MSEELTDLAGKQAYRREDDDVYQRDREGRETNFRATPYGGNPGGVTSLEELENILQHDDAVVDEDADGERKRKGGQEVERESLQVHERKGGDERSWDRQKDDQRAPP